MIVMPKFTVLLLLLCVLGSSYALAQGVSRTPHKCILPAPDGGDTETPNAPNIHGKIIEKTNATITVFADTGNRKTVIELNSKTELYTVYGGDSPVDELRPGLEAWIYYENCSVYRGQMPVARMIWVYSMDPDDVNTGGWQPHFSQPKKTIK
jgi:hypothetical protein